MFLANLARDPTDKIPIQTTSSTVLAVFLFVGTFVVNYIRMYFPKGKAVNEPNLCTQHTNIAVLANFGCVFACIILTVKPNTRSSNDPNLIVFPFRTVLFRLH